MSHSKTLPRSCGEVPSTFDLAHDQCRGAALFLSSHSQTDCEPMRSVFYDEERLVKDCRSVRDSFDVCLERKWLVGTRSRPLVSFLWPVS
jgi:hypothetical protein